MARRHHWTAADRAAFQAHKSAPPEALSTVSKQDLDVVFQPIVDLSTGKAMAFEALVRCKREQLRNPAVLFEVAVRQQFVGRLGRMIREVTFARCNDFPLFVNIHPGELAARWLVRPDDPIGFHNHAVYLEITESAAFEHRELCERVLREVCSRTGAKMVIDDFGQGYSNLHRIIALEPEVVKLDMSLVRNLHRDKRKQTIVKHAVKMCVEAGAKVVAEGIETPRELQACQEAGAHYGQGYLFARPSFPPRNIRWPARAGGSTPAPGRLQRPKFKIKT